MGWYSLVQAMWAYVPLKTSRFGLKMGIDLGFSREMTHFGLRMGEDFNRQGAYTKKQKHGVKGVGLCG